MPRKGKTKTTKVGIIGCGAIGTLIAQAVERGTVKCEELILHDRYREKAEQLRRSLRFPAVVVSNLAEMLRLKPAVIVEAASQQALKEYIDQILAADIDLIVMSTGALLGLDRQSSRVHAPSGAVGGLDALSSAALAGISEVVLTSRKNPQAFEMDNKEAKLMYEGSAEEAARLFPREMNVAATLALAVKPARVKVQVISDPGVERNTHEIRVKWRFGEMFLVFANDPHPQNPSTSALAAWSAIRLLRTLLAQF